MFGNHKRFLLTVVILLVGAQAHACPACFVTQQDQDVWQRFWAMAFMGTIPLVIAGIVIWKIKRMVQHGQ